MITTSPVRHNQAHDLGLVESLRPPNSEGQICRVTPQGICFDPAAIHKQLLTLDQPCHVVKVRGNLGVTQTIQSQVVADTEPAIQVMTAPPLSAQQLGDPAFCRGHGVDYPYAAGAMAGGIASEAMVIALGKAKILSSYGTGGLSLERIESAIQTIQDQLPWGPYAFNLLHNPHDQTAELQTVSLYIKHQVRTVEASAFLDLTPSIVYYRAAGLHLNNTNQVEIRNHVIAKLSREEIAAKFLRPAPAKILQSLVQQNLITEQQAALAERVPMADDITVEADSGGHTDNRALVCLLPAILELRDSIQQQYQYPTPVRVGAAGGIGTPESALAAFMMGAAYVVTGSVNQACVEAACSAHTKSLLASAAMHDVMMAPAADMFEMGVRLQVLKRGTLFPLRAQKLYELYKTYDAIEAIPPVEREKLEKQIFRRPIDEIWGGTKTYLSQRNPQKLVRAEQNPKLKMALIFRWYLGLSSRWSCTGEPEREVDYQIWCGPAIGAFNAWVKDSYLAEPGNRSVVDVAHHVLTGAAFLYRIQTLKMQGLRLSSRVSQYPLLPLRN